METSRRSRPREPGVSPVGRGTQAKADVFAYIERLYNAKRRHSMLGSLSHLEFENTGVAKLGIVSTEPPAAHYPPRTYHPDI